MAAPGRAPELHVVVALEQPPRANVHAESAADRSRLWIALDRPDLRDALDLLLGPEWESLFDDPNDPGWTIVLGGIYSGQTLFAIAELGDFRWFAAMLARLGREDWMRAPIEKFVAERLPDLWGRYCTWRGSQQESTA